MYICSIVPYSSKRLGGGEAGNKGVRLEWTIRYYIRQVLWLRREHGYLSAQASTDRKAGRLSLPFYSIEFFATDEGETDLFRGRKQKSSAVRRNL